MLLHISASNGLRFTGDFEEIYGLENQDESHEGQWDAVLTCFFIDTVRLFILSKVAR